MGKYRKRPVEIEAFRLGVQSPPQWWENAIARGDAWYQGGDEPCYTIKTLEGEMRATTGHWIVRGVEGELYPVKPDIFIRTYEPVSEE